MYRRTCLTASLVLALLTIGIWTVQGQQSQGPNTGQNEIVAAADGATICQIGPNWLIGSQGLLFIVVLIGLLFFLDAKASCRSKGTHCRH